MEQPKEYPQLQLEEQEKIRIITYYAMITEGEIASWAPDLNFPIHYATQSVHTKLNLPSTIKDPVMPFKIVDNFFNIKFKKVIPLKHTFNLNDGSILTTVKRNGSQLYPNNPLLRDKQFVIKIICVKNPKLEGKSFAQQRYVAKEQFYKNPQFWAEPKQELQQLVSAGIVNKKTQWSLSQTNNDTPEYREYDAVKHGPNGCASDKILRQSIIEEKILPGTSYFKALRNRELTGSFRKNH